VFINNNNNNDNNNNYVFHLLGISIVLIPFLAGHSKLELQVQSPNSISGKGKTGDEKAVSILQRRCATLEHQLKQEQFEKQHIQEHSEQVAQDMTTAQLQLQQQLAREKREAIQTKQQLEQQLQQQTTEIQQLQQRLGSATIDKQQLQQRLTSATTDSRQLQHDKQQLQQRLISAITDSQQLQHDKQQLQQRLTSATTDNQELQQRLAGAITDNQQLQQRLTHATAELQSLQDIEPWKISRNKVEIQARIGEGGWGSVSEGTVRVAVKKLHDPLLSQHNIVRVQREMRMLAQVRHPNLVQFIGVVFDEAALGLQASPMIITELLEMNLRTAYERRLEFNKLSVFLDVAQAMKYLHTRQEPIIHRDISAPNVLLEALPNRVWKGKVSDLGSANLAKLARTLGEGAIIYAAPETMPQAAHRPRAPKPRQTTKVDVYSFGVLLCEVGTSQFPNPDHYQDMLEQVQREWPALHELIVSCTQENPDERPTMTEVHTSLSHISH